MGVSVALLISLLAIGFALWPILRHQHELAASNAEHRELLAERDLAIADIRELDFDRDLGNLSDEDHSWLRDQSKRRAVAVLKKLQAEDSRIDREIEQAVAGLRASPSDPA